MEIRKKMKKRERKNVKEDADRNAMKKEEAQVNAVKHADRKRECFFRYITKTDTQAETRSSNRIISSSSSCIRWETDLH